MNGEMSFERKVHKVNEWILNKVNSGNIEEISRLVVVLMSEDVKVGQLPVFSSFPGNLAEEIDYEKLIYHSDNLGEEYPDGLVSRIVKCLSPMQSAIFCFRNIMDYTQEKTAKILGCSHQRVCQIEAHIKKKLKGNDKLRKDK